LWPTILITWTDDLRTTCLMGGHSNMLSIHTSEQDESAQWWVISLSQLTNHQGAVFALKNHTHTHTHTHTQHTHAHTANLDQFNDEVAASLPGLAVLFFRSEKMPAALLSLVFPPSLYETDQNVHATAPCSQCLEVVAHLIPAPDTNIVIRGKGLDRLIHSNFPDLSKVRGNVNILIILQSKRAVSERSWCPVRLLPGREQLTKEEFEIWLTLLGAVWKWANTCDAIHTLIWMQGGICYVVSGEGNSMDAVGKWVLHCI